MFNMSALYWIDFYKVGHVSQYPERTTQIWANWTPRSTRVKNQDHIVFFGLQYFMLEFLIDEWNRSFFQRPLTELLEEYRVFIKTTLGVENPKTDHIECLHKIGYLPIRIYALPEGTNVGLGIPTMVLTNTVPEMYWLPNYLETILSNMLWRACTSASTAQQYRKLFMKYARESGETDFSFIDWMGHDFSMRGMSGREDAILSGMAHLLSFSGTDSVPAIFAAKQYYNADFSCGGSVPATEHSVMCAAGQDDELETFRRLIEDIYPTGVVSIVSDTWDLWKVLTEYVPALKDKILARGSSANGVPGKVVIRPDSGDPEKILCGSRLFKWDQGQERSTPEAKGTLRLLAEAMGVERRVDKLPLINKMGAIYGDSITLERADAILNRVVNELELSPYNCVFGIGSYTYCYVTRDTYGFAMKATATRRNGVINNIFKKPVTDDGGKNSHKGIPAVYRTIESTEDNPTYFVVQEATEKQLDDCAFLKVFEDGKVLVRHTFNEIRERVRNESLLREYA